MQGAVAAATSTGQSLAPSRGKPAPGAHGWAKEAAAGSPQGAKQDAERNAADIASQRQHRACAPALSGGDGYVAALRRKALDYVMA